MSRLAVSGSPPGHQPLMNACAWAFSNPFSVGSDTMKDAPATVKGHTIPIIPGDKPFLVDPATDAQISFSRTRHDALRIAAGLHALGLRPSKAGPAPKNPRRIPPVISPVVMLHIPNWMPYAPLLFGVFAAGLTATLANPAFTSSELAWLLQSSKPVVIVTTSATLWTVRKAIEEVEDEQTRKLLRKSKVYVVDPAAKDYNVFHREQPAPAPADNDWKQLLHSCPLEKPVEFSPAECRSRTAVILWSSGTTGKSKGVPLSHRSIITGAIAIWYRYPEFDANEKWLALPPFYHVFGLNIVMALGSSCGATLYLMPAFDLKTMLAYVSKYHLTFLPIAPPVAVLLGKSPLLDGADMSSVKASISGGAPIPPAVVDLVYQRLGFPVKLGYGLSEAGPVANQVGHTHEAIQSQHRCSGPPTYGTELKIISTDGTAKTLQIDEEGEVLIRSPSLLNGYLNNEAATAESLDDDGWFHTGDIGKIDERGYIWITDRVKEMIKVKGFQVAPSELEAILCTSDRVADATVGSVYDEATGTELPRAYIVPADAALHSQCAPARKSQDLTALRDLGQHVRKLVEERSVHYKWLRGNVIFVQQIPRSPAGKILRRFLPDTKGVEVVVYPAKRQADMAKL